MRSPFISGIIYLTLTVLFTSFAIFQVNENGWGFLVYALLVIATLDFVRGVKFISLHFKQKKKD